jgi:hypothetical protein
MITLISSIIIDVNLEILLTLLDAITVNMLFWKQGKVNKLITLFQSRLWMIKFRLYLKLHACHSLSFHNSIYTSISSKRTKKMMKKH